MRTLFDIGAVLIPLIFVLLCLRVVIASIGPVLLPLAALAFIAFVVWLWINKGR